MTHEQLVEKVHAIVAGDCHGISETLCRTDCECRDRARAAIAAVYEAMREPTMRMIMDGVYYRLNTAISSENPWPEDTVTFFRAMLEASPLKGE